jgi:hypothetical protein
MANDNLIFTLTTIAIVIFVLVGMLVSQARHKALVARNDKIKKLTLQQRQVQNLLRSLPANYLSMELRDFLYQAVLQNLKSHAELIPDRSMFLREDYDQLAAEREQVKLDPPAPITILMSVDQASIYRSLLKSLHQFIRNNFATGRLEKAYAESLLKQVALKLVETAVDFFTLTAREFRKKNKYRQTTHAFQKALDTIKDSPFANEFKAESFKIQSELTQEVDQWNLLLDAERAEAQAKLDAEISAEQDEENSWKKKRI